MGDDHLGVVGGPRGGVEDELVPRVEDGEHGVLEGLLPAQRYDHVLGVGGDVVLLPELVGDGLP